MTEEATKEFVVHSGSVKASIEVTSKDTLKTARALICEDFDKDMFPEHGGVWFFWVDGMRKSSKQEDKMLAWDAIQRGMIKLKPGEQPKMRPLVKMG